MIQDIINSINTSIQDCLNLENAVYYGVAHTIEPNNNEKYPVTTVDGKLVRICLNDSYSLQIYHKLSQDDFTASLSDEFSFGRIETYKVEAKVKMIVILRASISEDAPPYNPLTFGRLIPRTVENSDYNNIRIEFSKVSNDHDGAISREWKKIDYSKHKCKFIVFEVSYKIRALTCNIPCTSYLLLEDLARLIQEDSSLILL